MIKLRALILVLLFSLSCNQVAKAYGDADSLDDTCTEGIGILNRIVADITTLGLFSAYSASFHIDGANNVGDPSGCDADYYPVNGNGIPEPHAETYPCPENDAKCNALPKCEPNGGMKICYEQWVIDLDDANCITGCYKDDCNWVTAEGWGPKWYYAPPGTILVVKSGDKICAQFDTSIGYQSIGCKYLPQCDVFELKKDCFVAESCSSQGAQKSRSILPISGVIIQCITESVERLFVDTEACTTDGSYTVTSFPKFQGAMRNAVRSCLMLYIILFGLKIVLGSEAPSKSELFVFGAKFVLVMYFSTGINISNANQEAVYADGITTYMKPLFMNGSASLAKMVYSAGGSQGLCIYNEEDYEDGYSYLSLWDSIDCRILYYFGIDMSKIKGQTSIHLSDLEPILLSLLLPAFLSFQLIFMVFAIIFFVFFLSVVIYFVNLTVISIILLGILIYLAPVFVPMVLFEVTKGYYEGWLKLTASYALQPMVVAAYIAMMMTIYDQTMFGDCRFAETAVEIISSAGEARENIPLFTLCDPNNDGDCKSTVTACLEGEENCNLDDNITQCKDSVGYILNPINSENAEFVDEINAIFFNITILKSRVVSDLLTGLITLCLFGYLFYKFADMLSEFAGELTGGPGLGSSAGDPMALVKAAGEAVMSVGKAAIQGDGKSGAAASIEKDESKSRSGAEVSTSNKGNDSSGAEASTEKNDKP